MGFIKLANLISPALKRAGVKKQADTAIALEHARKLLKDFLGEDACNELQPAYIRYRTLTIASLNSSAAAQVGLIEEDLVFLLNKHFPRPIIDRVRVITL